LVGRRAAPQVVVATGTVSKIAGRYSTPLHILSVEEYKNVQRWADTLLERPAVKRGRMVNRVSGDPSSQLHERHDAGDFATKTQDKLVASS
jgi:GSH-dependent disulfide-bond oxidoreductase